MQQTISSVLTTVALVENVNPPKTKVDIIRCKPLNAEHSSVHAAGSVEGDTADFSGWFDPMDDGHEILLAAVHNSKFSGSGSISAAARKKTWNIRFGQLVNAGTAEPRAWTFVGVQKNFNVTIANGEPLATIETEPLEALSAWIEAELQDRFRRIFPDTCPF
jgi:hypothetical protein